MIDAKFTKIDYDDLKFVNQVRNSFAGQYLHDSTKFTFLETVEWWKQTDPEWWIIWHNKERVGYFRLSSYSEKNQNIYIGADIHQNFHGKGIGYAAYMKFLPRIIALKKLNKISLEVLSTNFRAIKLYKKIGFIEEGIKRQEVKKGDIYIDSIIMSILTSEWQNG